MKSLKKKLIQIIALMVCIFITTSTALAHSGRTDSSGGHRDNKNKSGLGSYHYHCGGNPPHLHSGECPYSSYSESSPASTRKPSISVSKAPNELNIGDSSQVNYSLSDTEESWSEVTSSNPEIVIIEDNKILRGVGEGTATITISANDVSTSFTVTVKAISVESIDIKCESEMQLGTSQKSTVIFTPENITDKSLTWTSNRPEIVEVSDDGTLSAKAVGKAKITCRAINQVEGSVKINVYEVFPAEIKTDLDELKIECEDKTSVEISILPEHANNKNYSLKIEDENIASVDENNRINAKKDGKTKLIITTDNGIIKEIPITVYHEPVTQIAIDDSNIEYTFFPKNAIDHKAEINLETKITPENATYKEIKWNSSNPDVISIKGDNIQIEGTGKVTLTALAHDDVYKEITFTVVNSRIVVAIFFSVLLILIISVYVVWDKNKERIKLKFSAVVNNLSQRISKHEH